MIRHHKREWSVWGFAVQEDSCDEQLGLWWPNYAVFFWLGRHEVVICHAEEEM